MGWFSLNCSCIQFNKLARILQHLLLSASCAIALFALYCIRSLGRRLRNFDFDLLSLNAHPKSNNERKVKTNRSKKNSMQLVRLHVAERNHFYFRHRLFDAKMMVVTYASKCTSAHIWFRFCYGFKVYCATGITAKNPLAERLIYLWLWTVSLSRIEKKKRDTYSMIILPNFPPK